ncbi:hypothetical protein HYV10_02175 [Candidatus Dependentiae bacterium]|nr:hypothetical protein [Candidatus Dependentiae bacterium]
MYCFCNLKKDNEVGIFLKHPDYLYTNRKELNVAINVRNLELNILEQVVQLLITRHYKQLDPLVGDSKCQTRASMLLDIFQQNQFARTYCDTIQDHLNEAKEHLREFIEKIDSSNIERIKNITNEFYRDQLSNFFKKNNLDYEISDELLIISLCYFLFFKYEKIVLFSENLLSNSKAQDLLLLAKKKLLKITLHYEQSLVEKYGNEELKRILKFKEINGFCEMTAFYPSLIPILNKIENKRQLILIKNIIFCECGGIKFIKNDLYQGNGLDKLERINSKKEEEVAVIIEGYCFNGSFQQLADYLGISLRILVSSLDNLKLCNCSKSFNLIVEDDIETIILSNAAHHKQFTNGAEIPWVELGLEDSELKKEYDYLRTLSGYSVDDMSKFCIRHIYVSTVGQELEDQRQFLLKLGKK